MADDFGSCPWTLYTDERLAEASLADITGATLIMMACDDYGRFEGRARVLARRIGSTPDEVEDLFERLERLRFVVFFDAPSDGGTRRVGEVVGFHDFPGLPFRAASPSQRGAALYPDRDGKFAPGRRARASPANRPARPPAPTSEPERASSVQEKTRARASSVQAGDASTETERASSVQDRRARARVPRARQHSTAQISTEGTLTGPLSVHGDPALAHTRAPEGAHVREREAADDEQHDDGDTAGLPKPVPSWLIPGTCAKGHVFVDVNRDHRCPTCAEEAARPPTPRPLPPRRMPQPAPPDAPEPTMAELLARVERERARERGEVLPLAAVSPEDQVA